MKAASIAEIKNELKIKPATELAELCLRLARHKKENKELLHYLLFEKDNLETYLESVKEEMDNSFSEVSTTNAYFAKKSLRKILRTTNKHIKYTGSKEAEATLLIHFCAGFKSLKIASNKNTALLNIYNSQVKKIEAAVAVLHDDLQHDYLQQIKSL